MCPNTYIEIGSFGAILSVLEIIFINQTYFMFKYKVPTNNLSDYWNNQRQNMDTFVPILGTRYMNMQTDRKTQRFVCREVGADN